MTLWNEETTFPEVFNFLFLLSDGKGRWKFHLGEHICLDKEKENSFGLVMNKGGQKWESGR